MSNMYAFKEETITALGDTVRAKCAGETRDVTVNQITFSNASILNYSTDQFTTVSGKYKYMTEPIALPNFDGYYQVSCEGLSGAEDVNNGVITVCFNGAYSTEYVGTVPASQSPVVLQTYTMSKPHTLQLSFTVKPELYDAGIAPRAELITITCHTSDGTQIEWTMQEKNTMTLAQMTDAIADAMTVPASALAFGGSDCSYKFAYNGWNWFIAAGGDKIVTTDIVGASYMFYNSTTLEEVPFEINLRKSAPTANMFSGAKKLTSIKAINNWSPSGATEAMFTNCNYMRYLPQFNNMDLSAMHANAYGNTTGMFNGCWSLREIPESFLKEIYSAATGYYYSNFNNGFTNCYSLNELRGLRGSTGTITSNMFSNTFKECNRLKEIIFATQEDGSPYVHQWKSQVIDLTQNIGVATSSSVKTYILGQNSGITADKEIKDQKTYDALKNDPDAFVTYYFYGRYNHDSAVRTINSLPDTSAYLASAGGTNTIKFSGGAGKMTDEGGINTLTEEEIAVATAKGWTVSIS